MILYDRIHCSKRFRIYLNPKWMIIKAKWNGASEASKNQNLDPEEYSSTKYVVYDFRIVEKRT